MTHNQPLRAILVVEDHPLIGELLGDMLEYLGHGVCAITSTHQAAVTAAVNLHPDLVIIDTHLGFGCGLEAMTEILSHRAIPHIFMSGDLFTLSEVRPNAVLLGKPFVCEQLQHAIHLATHPAPTALNAQA